MANMDLKSSQGASQPRVFVSYHFGEHELFITQVCYFLRRQGIETYFHGQAPILKSVPAWVPQILAKLEEADAILLFYGSVLGDTQDQEFNKAKEREKRVVLIELPGSQPPDEIRNSVTNIIHLGSVGEDSAFYCAKRCCELLEVQWIVEDDIPAGYPFDYERAIIDVYLRNKVDSYLISQGCPQEWPQITRKAADVKNPVPESDIGKYRDVDSEGQSKSEDPQVFVDTTSDFSPVELRDRRMVLPLAGPRRLLHFYSGDPEEAFKVGVLVSGGIAPGTNAVISAIVERHALYAAWGGYNVEVLGYCDGFRGLLRRVNPIILERHLLEKTFDQGGSILGTSRLPGFVTGSRQERNRCLEDAVSKIKGDGIQILYVIGGDGSMRAAHVLWKRIEGGRSNISIVTIPKTMDNDVLWGWQTFGFESAVEKANEIIHQVHVEAESNPRLGVLQLFGSDSGYVVTHAALASGLCNLFLIPEVPFTMRWVWKFIAKQAEEMARKGAQGGVGTYRWHGLILMAEAAIPLDAQWYVDRDEVALTDAEKREVREYLHLDYWDKPPLEMKASAAKIRRYLGLDQDCGYDDVEALDDKDKRCLREYARHLRTRGQTPDGLRSAGLKLVSRVLQERFCNDSRQLPAKYWRDFRVFTNEPRHAIRAVSPRSSDILFAHRLGTLAVDGAMAGYTDFMISQWLTEYVMVPLRLVVLGRKRVPEKGIFYCSARASTRQPPDLI